MAIDKSCGTCQKTESTQSFAPCNPCACDCHVKADQPSPVDEIKTLLCDDCQRMPVAIVLETRDSPDETAPVLERHSVCNDCSRKYFLGEPDLATSHAQLQQENERLAAKLELARNLMNAAIPAEECVRGCSNGGQPNQGDALVISTQLAFAIRSFAALDGIEKEK